MAGDFAKKIGAQNLVLTHFSSRYQNEEETISVKDLLKEAQVQCPQTQVIAAVDFMKIDIQ